MCIEPLGYKTHFGMKKLFFFFFDRANDNVQNHKYITVLLMININYHFDLEVLYVQHER